MAGYIITEIEVTDPVGYEDYRKLVPASLAAYGGEFVVRGGAIVSLEGDWDPKRVVVTRFESVARALEWYNSAEYAEAKDLRHRYSTGRMIVVEGV